jgi:hypothetical protein
MKASCFFKKKFAIIFFEKIEIFLKKVEITKYFMKAIFSEK